MIKRKIYIILLLLLIIFVALSFHYILNFCVFHSCSIREGLCLPNCDDVKISQTTTTVPDCTPLEYNLLKKDDAIKIYYKIINPFITTINNKIKIDYSYNLIFSLTNAKPTNQTTNLNPNLPNTIDVEFNQNLDKIKSYFNDFSYNITLQDKMDNLISNLSQLQSNPIFIDEKETIMPLLQKYKDERTTDFLEIYNKLINDIMPYGEKILIENDCKTQAINKNYYKDENFRLIIEAEKKNPVYYGENSSFHKIYNYIKDAMNEKLGTV